MCASWKNDQAPTQIIAELNNSRSQKNNTVQYKNVGVITLIPTLISFISFNPAVHESQYSEIVRKALFIPTPNGRLSRNSLIRGMSALESAYLRKTSQTFVLYTNLSFSGTPPFSWLSWFNSRIFFKGDFLKFDRSGIQSSIRRTVIGAYPMTYAPVAIEVRAKSPTEAGPIAIDKLDLLRAVWNLPLNRSHGYRLISGRPDPVNKIRNGPIQTLHYKNGRLACTTFWYEPEYIGPGNPINMAQYRDRLRNQTSKIRKALIGSKLQSETETALLRYTRALDDSNLDNAFGRLWGVLEFLVNSHRHDVVAKRAASLFSNYQLALDIAKHLRERRNIAVHSNTAHTDAEALVFQLKIYVEHILQIYIFNVFDIASREELAAILDLPPEFQDLRRRVKLMQRVVRYRMN